MQQWASWGKKIDLSSNTWFQKYQELSAEETNHILLESGRGGRYSIMGLRPFAILKGSEGQLEIQEQTEKVTKQGNPLQLMKEWMKKYEAPTNPELPSFQSGAIGYLSYDYVRYVEKLPASAKNDLAFPELYFLMFHDVFVYDHHTEELWVMVHDQHERKEAADDLINEYIKKWTSPVQHHIKYEKIGMVENPLSVSMEEEEFQQAVEKIKQYISQGDVFQVNLSVRQSKPLHTHPMNLYEQLRSVNPSPYMSYMQTQDFHIVSSSPELLIKKQGKELSTRPIAGTRSRGRNAEEDLELANELIQNEKERAEHVMLVDLERNDLGRVSQYGTVEVDEFMVIEKYSHVMHIVSNVKGMVQDNKDFVDVIDAVFPGGTITGAPKIRTMEIIEELEPVRRGLYTGSIGWIGFNGDMELNIVIRTMLVEKGEVHVQAGAGIVIDSNPSHEYKESLKKAMALWKAKELSEKELSGGSRE
ncbi:anthranilate synthase component I [Priestia koreensis]|uniref:anthranilate synthase component I n=1 Tax=Priestia koreensis TaxID=284581 RepID=UPI0028F6C3C1|nr:anthranilate synthase component I [Priestia koreensis]